MARRSDHTPDELKRLVLDAAKRILHEQGMEALTLRALAKAVGYTPGAFYHHFANRDDIILHLNAETLDALTRRMEEAAKGQKEAQARLKSYADTYLAFAAEEADLWWLAFEHRLPEGVTMPDWLTGRIERLFAMVEESIRQLPSPPADPRLAGHALWAGIHGIAALRETNKLDIASPAEPERLAELMLAALSGKA